MDVNITMKIIGMIPVGKMADVPEGKGQFW